MRRNEHPEPKWLNKIRRPLGFLADKNDRPHMGQQWK